MKAIILNVGNEVLSGKVVNTNSSYLGYELGKLGIELVKTVVVGDDEEMISSEVEAFRKSEYDILITTGGLGPTHDDFTKEVICKVLNKELVLRNDAKKVLDSYFQGEYAKCNIKQAYFPEDAILLDNCVGTADGAIIEDEGKSYIILVGPPFELKPMFITGVIPYLESKQEIKLNVSEYIIMGIGESLAEDLLQDFSTKFPNIQIAPYASLGHVRYQIQSNPSFEKEFNEANSYFSDLMKDYIISTENEMIEECVVKMLLEKEYHLAAAESCTGGLLAATLINVSGASGAISESVVTYSNDAKIRYLGVNPETITKHGVVSGEVVREMVNGLENLTQSECNIAISGIAGPTGGTKEKPVGLVWYAISLDDDLVVESKIFKGDREQVRIRAVKWILYRLYCMLKNK